MIFNKGVYTYRNIYDLLPSLKEFQESSSLRYVIVTFIPHLNHIGFQFSNTCLSFMYKNGVICAYRKSGRILFICDKNKYNEKTFYYDKKDTEISFLLEHNVKDYFEKFIDLDIKYIDLEVGEDG